MDEINLGQGAIEIAPAGIDTKVRNSRPSDGELAGDISYWRERLAGIPAILELSTDRPRPRAQSFHAARESIRLPQSLSRDLETLSEREGTALFVVLLAAFQTLLTRYTRQEDIVVGSRIPGGEQVDSRALIGSFTTIRTDTSGDPTFREVLSRVREAVAGAREHPNVPWDRLVKAVQPDQDASRHPVFQATFLLEESQFLPDSDWEIPGLASEPDTLEVDLQVQLNNLTDGLATHFVYSTDLFDAATIVRMAEHFRMLLEGIVAHPDQRISRLPLLTDPERHQLVVEWNDTRTDYPRERCLHELFEQSAERTPDATAVVFENERVTYGELNRRASQLARYLVKLGVGPEVLVGICVERSLEMVVGLLGILKAGGAYVPVDPAFPSDRVAFMLEDAEVPVLLTQEHLIATLPERQATVVRLDADWPEIARESSENLASRAKPDDLAYTMYTSGSTGKPKGVQIQHRALVNFLVSMSEKPGMTKQDHLLAVTTLSFDIAGLEIYLPLTLGASVEIVSRSVYSDGHQLLAKLISSSATVMQATPVTWRLLIEAGWQGSPNLKILVGGEAVPHKLANQLLQRAETVWNMYGPTETTIWSTTRKLEPGEVGVSIGRPIANTEIYILDKVMQPVPVGVAGELLIGGDGLAKGYFKRPELTGEKFIPHPFSQDQKARLYRTGDLVRYRPNGDIEFLGRIDHQIKIRGFRIELGEIEAVLRQYPGVNETVVVAREDLSGDPRLVAYLVPGLQPAPAAGELRSFLKQRLPEYMLPSDFVMLSSMPLTPNGKINRRALPQPELSRLTAGDKLVAPRDLIESQLVKIWESVLAVRPIGINHDFFELGGHSLLAVRLMQRIQQTFGQKLSVAALLQARTIEQLAEIVRQEGWSSPWSSLVPIQVSGTKLPFFCVHGAGGVIIRFHDLARYLGNDQPVYGLQARGLDGKHPCDTRVEDMAAHYLKEIRSVQPHAPYLLGGYSMGGMVAVEIAQQLIAQGEEQVLVVLFDTFCTPKAAVNGSNSPSDRWRLFYRGFSTASQKFLGMPLGEMGALIARGARVVKTGIERRVSEAMLPRALKNVRRGCALAAKEYVPRPYSGRLILFRSSDKPLLQLRDPHVGWSTYAAGGLEIHEVRGNHDDILLKPQVEAVAEQLKVCLDRALIPNEVSK
jgi:amino acid adenylation domain-containing protein